MSIVAEDTVSLAQHDDEPHRWFIFKDKAGFPISFLKSGKGVLDHPELVKELFDVFSWSPDENYKLYLSLEPFKERRRAYWELHAEGETVIEEEEPA